MLLIKPTAKRVITGTCAVSSCGDDAEYEIGWATGIKLRYCWHHARPHLKAARS